MVDSLSHDVGTLENAVTCQIMLDHMNKKLELLEMEKAKSCKMSNEIVGQSCMNHIHEYHIYNKYTIYI